MTDRGGRLGGQTFDLREEKLDLAPCPLVLVADGDRLSKLATQMHTHTITPLFHAIPI